MPKPIDIPAFCSGDEDAMPVRLAPPAFAQLSHEFLFHVFFQPGIEGRALIFVDLIKDDQYRLFEGFQLLKGLIDHPQLLFVAGMGDVDYMQQDIRFPDLIQGALKYIYLVVVYVCY